jgi:hypothetical protein
VRGAEHRSVCGLVQDALSPKEWARVGAMAAVVIGLSSQGFGMLAAADPPPLPPVGTETFGSARGSSP